MQYTHRSLEKFKQLYLKLFGEKLSDEEVKRKANYLVDVYQAAYGMPSIKELFNNGADEEKKE